MLLIVSSIIIDPADADLPIYSLSKLPLIVYACNPIVSVAVKSVTKFTLIMAVSIVLPIKIGLSGSYPDSGKLFLENLGKDVSPGEFLKTRELELGPEKIIKVAVPGKKLNRK